MNRLDEFLSILCGHFDNAAQVRKLEEQGVRNFPFAEHVNTVCQDKITGLPTDFHGKFVLEESYYTTDGKPMPRRTSFSLQRRKRGFC